MKKIKLALLLIPVVAFEVAYGADPKMLLRKFAESNQQRNMCYDYRMSIWNKATKKDVDSVRGCLAVWGGQYIDSNSKSYTARIGQYYSQFSHDKKTAAVVDMHALAKSVGVTLENDEQKVLYNISETVIQHSGGNYVIDSSKDVYQLRARLVNYPVSYVQVEFRKTDFKMVSAYVEMDEGRHDSNKGYINRLFIRNIRYHINSTLFDNSRLFRLDGTRIVLTKKYSNYKLI